MKFNRIYIPADKDCIELLESWSIDLLKYDTNLDIIKSQKPEWLNNNIITFPAGTSIRFVRVCVGNSPYTNIDIKHPDLTRIINYQISNKKINEIKKFKIIDNLAKRVYKKPSYEINWNWHFNLKQDFNLNRYINIENIKNEEWNNDGLKKIKVYVGSDTANSTEITTFFNNVAIAKLYAYCDVIEIDKDLYNITTKQVELIITKWEWDLYGYDGVKLGTYKTQDSLRRVTRAYIDKDINKAKNYFINK
jgi:hypothetical protein